MIANYFNRAIENKYPNFDKEERRNIFVSYLLNIATAIYTFFWAIIFYDFDRFFLAGVCVSVSVSFLLLFLVVFKFSISFKLYRFILATIIMAGLSVITITLGRFSSSLYVFYLVPMGMIMVFSRKEKRIFFIYLFFFGVVFLGVLYYTFTQDPLANLSSQDLQETNFNDAWTTMILSFILAYLYWNQNSILQKLLVQEQEKSDRLLLSIFPQEIAKRLKGKQESVVESYENVTVLFADIVGFTSYSERMTPKELVAMLDELFSALDKLAEKHEIEKIKTIGDSYMAVSGLPIETPQHCQNMANFALEANKVISKEFNPKYKLQLRFGIHSGRVIAGVIGKNKFSYDMWGLTVNTASRYESQGAPAKIHISEATMLLLNENYEIEYNGVVSIKGLGERNSYFLVGKKES